MNQILKNYDPKELQKIIDSSNYISNVLEKIGLPLYGKNYSYFYEYVNAHNLDLTMLNSNKLNHQRKCGIQNKKNLQDIITGKEIYKSSNHLKKRLINEGYKEEKCEICGRTEWLNEKIPLQLDHIDGDHSNNLINNLRILCPNCHAQTPTYCSKNHKNKHNIITANTTKYQHSDSPNSRAIPMDDIFNNFVSCRSNWLKYRLIREGYKENKCEKCGCDRWNNLPIPLELHHIDGNKDNNAYQNLQLLCPNCHQVTDNFCGRNKKQYKRKITAKLERESLKEKDLDYYGRNYQERSRSPGRDILKQEIRTNSFIAIGDKYGVSDNAVRKWCKHYGLPYQARIIKHISDEEWQNV